MKPIGILLAAGSARRFGGHKLLQPLPDGVAVGVAAARALQGVLSGVIAVVRPGDHDLHTAYTDMGLHVVENPDAARGMGSSLAVGMKAAPEAPGWIIALADMPWVRSATVGALAERLQHGASIVAPVYRGQRGNPVGFSCRWFAELAALSGQRGARELLVQHADALLLVDCDDRGVLADVDYPTDLR